MSSINHQLHPASSVSQFSARDQAYLSNPGQFMEFMAYNPQEVSFDKIAHDKSNSYSPQMRSLMFEVLTEQTEKLHVQHGPVLNNVHALKEANTFAIITAHQPCLMSGPLYFIYKIASAISLAQKLSEDFPNLNFVPMYVLGSEDHDFEEINHLRLFGKTIEWNAKAQGAVGDMKLTGIEEVLAQVAQMISKAPYHDLVMESLHASYRPEKTLAEATATFVYSVFGEHGIVVANLNDTRLKAACSSLFEAELFEQFAESETKDVQSKIQNLGFNTQIFARPINLFHLDEYSRSRVERNGDEFGWNNVRMSKSEMREYVQLHPDRFSPNVVLRPVYQQMILPGIAYIGGGAEVAYWMELYGVFKSVNLHFPVLLRRDSAIWIKPYTSELMRKTGINIEQLFTDLHEMQTQFLKSEVQDDWSLEAIQTQFDEVFNLLSAEVAKNDPGLVKMVKGTAVQHENFMQKLEGKIKKSLKNQHDISMNRLEKIWSDLFPANSLQERKDNFMGIYSRIGPQFIETLIDNFNPLISGIHIFREGNDLAQ